MWDIGSLRETDALHYVMRTHVHHGLYGHIVRCVRNVVLDIGSLRETDAHTLRKRTQRTTCIQCGVALYYVVIVLA